MGKRETKHTIQSESPTNTEETTTMGEGINAEDRTRHQERADQ